MRETVKNALTLLIAVVFALVLAEAVLRFLPVNEGLRMQPVNDASPITRFQADRTSTWSRFADLSMVNAVHANNYGFINDQDYVPGDGSPLLAVIGDSYVEAAMVPYAETLQGRLARAFQGQRRVYSFGISGAPLSQYLALAEFVRDEFSPDRMAFVIIANDFDESMAGISNGAGFHLFERDKDSTVSLVRSDYAPGTLRRLARHSRLLMYLLTNVQVQHLAGRLFRDDGAYVGQTSADASEARLALARTAVDAFLSMLPGMSGLAPDHIFFLVDGIRPALYDPKELGRASGSYFDIMRRYFLTQARKQGYLVIDMQPAFIRDFERNGKRFEFPRDGHWNARGHGVAAKQLARSLAATAGPVSKPDNTKHANE